jgi:phosphinothricin acetyltransferase
MQIVHANRSHLDQIAAIYNAEIVSSPATFDLDEQPIGYWEAALEAVDDHAGHFLLVAVVEDGTVLGFAKSGRFRDRPAYDTTCETSVYVAEPARGKGTGKALYVRLLELLEASSARVAVGVMTEPNPASRALHESLGFTLVGTFEDVGVKFGKAWDVTWYQRSVRR